MQVPPTENTTTCKESPPISCTMASFSMTYSPKKGISPYQDWLRLRRPAPAIFKYTDHMLDNIFTVIFDPNLNGLLIDIELEEWTMKATVRMIPDNMHKTLRIECATCTATNYWPLMNGPGCPSGSGGARFMRKSLGFVRDLDVLKLVARELFGIDWTVLPIGRGKLSDSSNLIEEMQDWHEVLWYPKGPWGKTTASFNTIQTCENAATKIQAVFRGWKARMKYRYNPYTRLGRYIVLREGGFL